MRRQWAAASEGSEGEDAVSVRMRAAIAAPDEVA